MRAAFQKGAAMLDVAVEIDGKVGAEGRGGGWPDAGGAVIVFHAGTVAKWSQEFHFVRLLGVQRENPSVGGFGQTPSFSRRVFARELDRSGPAPKRRGGWSAARRSHLSVRAGGRLRRSPCGAPSRRFPGPGRASR